MWSKSDNQKIAVDLTSGNQKIVIDLTKNGWDIIEITGKFVMAIAIFSLGLAVQTADSRGAVEAEYVKLAIGLLADEPTDNNDELRLWAATVLDTYSEVEISESLLEKLETDTLPPPFILPENAAPPVRQENNYPEPGLNESNTSGN